jgi:hypothetical protein
MPFPGGRDSAQKSPDHRGAADRGNARRGLGRRLLKRLKLDRGRAGKHRREFKREL